MTKKKLISGQILAPFGPNVGPKSFFSGILPLLDVRHCCKLSLYPISRKTNEPNLRKWQKTSFGLDHQNISSKIWLGQSLDIMVSYHHVQYQKKLMIKS